MRPKTVRASFRFLQWQNLYDREKPFQLLSQLSPSAEDQRTTNLVFDDEVVEVEDVRSTAFSPTLDGHGFMFRTCPSVLPDFTDQKIVEEQYFLEVEKLIKTNVEDAKQIYIFDWRLRNTAPESAPGTVLDLNDRTTYLRPAIHFHVGRSESCNVDMGSNVLRRSKFGRGIKKDHVTVARVCSEASERPSANRQVRLCILCFSYCYDAEYRSASGGHKSTA